MYESAKRVLVSEEWFAAIEEVVGELVEVRGATVGEWIGFEPAPEVLDGVKFGGVRRQELDMQPGMLFQEISHLGAAMRREAVPHEHDVAGQLSQKLAEELDHPFLVDGLVGVQTQQQSQSVTARADRHGADDRKVLMPAAPLMENRCLASDRPGAADERVQEKAGFILENEMGREARGLFLIRRQSLRTQVAMASSSRSKARRCGLCGVKPRRRKRRGRWSTWYVTLYRRSMSAWTRGQVHRSVSKPCEQAPEMSRSIKSSCWRSVRKLARPGCGTAAKASCPSSRTACRQRSTLRRDTPSRLATSSGDNPLSRSATASSLRCSNCWALPCVRMPSHNPSPEIRQ